MPGLRAGHIDLSEAAFSAIAPLSAGLVNVSYQYLASPSLPGPVSLRVKEGFSQYWLALLAMNTGNPLASVQVESEPGGGWNDLVRVPATTEVDSGCPTTEGRGIKASVGGDWRHECAAGFGKQVPRRRRITPVRGAEIRATGRS